MVGFNAFVVSIPVTLCCFLNIFFCQELQDEFPEKCLLGLGCFKTGPPFYELPHRFLSFLPFDTIHLDTKFLLFTPHNTMEPEVIRANEDFAGSSIFHCWRPTKVLIPGFTSVVRANDSNHLMKNTLLSCAPYNVIILDWSTGSQSPYPQAVANARVVAAQLAKFLQFLIDKRCICAPLIHLIGHSLGAHLAGWTGSRMKNLGRITGLDPAGPYFYEAPPEVKLDDSDALFVDVIHTNGATKYEEGLGLEEAIGHLDFYVNGGTQQPGCHAPKELDAGFDPRANSCSHGRAIGLFITSILGDTCRFFGVECDSYEDFVLGRCCRQARKRPIAFVTSAEMGLHARKPRRDTRGKKYYLATSAHPPYCISR